MIFPFEITRKYKLPDSEFGDYTTTEIIDNVYEFLYKEEFASIKKENNVIEICGDKDRLKRHINWFRTDRVTHLIDKGVIRIIETENERRLIYTFQIKKYFIWSIPELIIIPLFLGLISWSISNGLLFLWIILAFDIIYTTYLITAHPATVSAPLEIMRFETIRKLNEK